MIAGGFDAAFGSPLFHRGGQTKAPTRERAPSRGFGLRKGFGSCSGTERQLSTSILGCLKFGRWYHRG
jgi:hypothetical protein